MYLLKYRWFSTELAASCLPITDRNSSLFVVVSYRYFLRIFCLIFIFFLFSIDKCSTLFIFCRPFIEAFDHYIYILYPFFIKIMMLNLDSNKFFFEWKIWICHYEYSEWQHSICAVLCLYYLTIELWRKMKYTKRVTFLNDVLLKGGDQNLWLREREKNLW